VSGDVDSPTDADKAPTFGATPADAGSRASTCQTCSPRMWSDWRLVTMI